MQSKLGRPLLRVQVYSCETNTWKEIRDHTLPVSPFKLICNLERKVYVKFDSNPVALVSFDVHDEVFTLLPCPENYINGQNVRNFFNWIGSLGVVVQNGRDEQAVYTIDESSGAWLKRYDVVDCLREFCRLLFCFNSGEIIAEDANLLYVFEPESNTFEILINRYPSSFVKIMTYKQSFFCVGGMQRISKLRHELLFQCVPEFRRKKKGRRKKQREDKGEEDEETE